MAKCMAREGLVEKPEMDETIQTLREEIHTIGRRFDAESHMINTALCSKHEELLAAIQRVEAASTAREEAAIAREEARDEARDRAAIARETLAFNGVETSFQQLEQIVSAHHLYLVEQLERNRIEEALRSKEGFEEAKEHRDRLADRTLVPLMSLDES